jgi:putative oxidoreductase
MKSLLAFLAEPAYAAMRIVFGVLFWFHGVQKLFGWFTDSPVAAMGSQRWFAGIIETFGGALIGIGLFTEIAVFIASGEMAVAYFQQHAPRGPWPIGNGGELAVMYCFAFLYFLTRGGGRFSLDALRRRRSKRT